MQEEIPLLKEDLYIHGKVRAALEENQREYYLKEQLRIIKELGPDGVYRYATAPKPAEHTFSAKLNLIFRQCITSVDYAQNMIVVKTMPGLANGAASAIDKLNIPEMLGTLAGDDTCFVVLKDTQAAAELCAEIREQIEH